MDQRTEAVRDAGGQGGLTVEAASRHPVLGALLRDAAQRMHLQQLSVGTIARTLEVPVECAEAWLFGARRNAEQIPDPAPCPDPGRLPDPVPPPDPAPEPAPAAAEDNAAPAPVTDDREDEPTGPVEVKPYILARPRPVDPASFPDETGFVPGELETTAGTGTRDLTRIPPRPRAPAEDGDSLVRRLGRRLLGNALPPPKRRAGAVLCWDELVDWLEEQGVRVDGIREGDVFRLCHPQAPSGPQSRAQVFIFANRLRAISGDPAFTVDLDRMRGSADEA